MYYARIYAPAARSCHPVVPHRLDELVEADGAILVGVHRFGGLPLPATTLRHRRVGSSMAAMDDAPWPLGTLRTAAPEGAIFRPDCDDVVPRLIAFAESEKMRATSALFFASLAARTFWAEMAPSLCRRRASSKP